MPLVQELSSLERAGGVPFRLQECHVVEDLPTSQAAAACASLRPASRAHVKPLVLSPPRVELVPELRWLLDAAFGAEIGPIPADEARVVALARALQISGRVGRRIELSRSNKLECAELSADFHLNIATESLLVRARQRIMQLAEPLGIPVIPLKFAALHAARVSAPGSRQTSDLDLLVPVASARHFWSALIDAGYQRTNTSEYAHQLETLFDPNGAVIDLHLHIPGVFGGSRSFATAEDLLARGLVRRTSDSNHVPSNAILAAHTIAHGLLQNRSTPQTHSPLRMVADLMDLRRVEPAVLELSKQHLAPALTPTCDTLERLCNALSNGDFASPHIDGLPEQTLLWHCLAARLDFDYSERLRAAGLMNKIRDGASLPEIAGYLATLFYPGEPALELLYGPASTGPARLVRRLRRPMDLGVRAVRRWVRSL